MRISRCTDVGVAIACLVCQLIITPPAARSAEDAVKPDDRFSRKSLFTSTSKDGTTFLFVLELGIDKPGAQRQRQDRCIASGATPGQSRTVIIPISFSTPRMRASRRYGCFNCCRQR